MLRDNPEDYNLEGCRALIFAILDQAYKDAISFKPEDNADEARRFISKNDEMFCYYCNLISLDPEYVARKMRVRIRMFDHKREKETIKNRLPFETLDKCA